MMTDRNCWSPSLLRDLPRNGFSEVRALVVGDLMLDQYVDGEVHRISPEAPVPVLSVRKRRDVAGGAANVALNVLGLRARAVLAGVVGNDPAGERLCQILRESGCDLDCVTAVQSRPTTSKTRIISGNHQIVRLDEEITEKLPSAMEEELLQRVVERLGCEDIQAVIFSDYDKGVLSGSLPSSIIKECQRRRIPVLVDPKRHDYIAYQGATCVTPNHKEFLGAIASLGLRGSALNTAGPKLREHLGCQGLLVTQGADGMTLFGPGLIQHFAAIAEEVFDVSGAGDTVIGTLGVALGSGLPVSEAVELANAAASLVVKRVGTSPVDWQSLSRLLGGTDRQLPDQ